MAAKAAKFYAMGFYHFAPVPITALMPVHNVLHVYTSLNKAFFIIASLLIICMEGLLSHHSISFSIQTTSFLSRYSM
jgi:hypothetical protein